MVTNGRTLLVGALATAALLSAAVSARQQARDVRRDQTGSASIAGVVVTADEAHRPLAWAAVTISSQTLAGPRRAVTDDEGRFTFDDLAAGQYALSASKPAYLNMNYGATQPERQGTSIVLADRQALSGLSIALPKGAVVAGTIRDGSGAPVPGAAVSVLRWHMLDGERTYVPVQNLTADTRGQYRGFGLLPGEYLISVDASTGEVTDATYSFVALSDTDISAALTRARQGGAASASVAPAAGTAPARRKSVGYALVFYPGTTDVSRAQRVTVSAGEQKDGLDLRLDLVPTARIDGTVSSPSGLVPAGLRVTLASAGPPVLNYRFETNGSLSPQSVDSDGRFSWVGVPPGEYSVTVAARPTPVSRGAPPPTPPMPATLAALALVTPDSDPSFAYARISVTGEDQRVSLTLQPGIVVAGRVTFDAAVPANAAPRVTMKDTQASWMGLQHTVDAAMAADGSFRVSGLGPSRFIFEASVPAGAWVPSSAMSNGRDWLDAPFDLKPGDRLTDLVVTMTDRPSGLSGKLLGTAGTITSDYFVIVFSEERNFWFPSSRRIVSVRPNTDGEYRVPSLPPGRYRIAAVTDVATGEWFDSDFLESLIPVSVSVGIEAHERKVQDLRIAR